MSTWSDLEELRARETWFGRAAIAAFGAALVALFAVLLHIETGAGAHISDVHVPANWLLTRRHDVFGFGEPYDVGVGWGKAVQWLTIVAFIGVPLGALWAAELLKIGEKPKTYAAITAAVLLSVFTPVPKLFIPGTAKAVSVATAEALLTAPNNGSLLRLGENRERQVTAYIRAQIAYARGDRDAARAISANIDVSLLSSPIEAGYRLQYLTGQHRGLSTVCFIRTGCLSEADRQVRLLVSAWLLFVMVVAGLVFAALAHFFQVRLRRIDALASALASRRVRGKNAASPAVATGG